MTPNGAFAVGLLLIALSMTAPGPFGSAVLIVLALVFALVEARGAFVTALRRGAMVVLPLALFMGVVWVGIVGESPSQIAADAVGTRAAALAYVAKLCARLFFIVVMVQLVFLRFAELTPLRLVRTLALPVPIKRTLVITLSLIETLRHAVDRAHTALIAAGTLTRAPSLRNVVHSWRLVQAVWLSAVTIVLGRVRDKWPVENTLALLDRTLEAEGARLFAGNDRIWLPITLVAAIVVLLADTVWRLS
jgi:hypothetical protein